MARKPQTPQEAGRDFEKRFAALLGVKPVKGSGSTWTAKMDVQDSTILWSLKWTGKNSFRLSRALFAEVERAINGPGGIGGTAIPGLALEVDGESYVCLRTEDFLRLSTQEELQYVKPTKAEEKRRRANVPDILR